MEQDTKKVKDIFQLWESLKNSRRPYEDSWKEITKFVSPERNFWDTIKEPQQSASYQIYDGTPLSAVNLLANGLQGYMASKATKSFKIGLESHRTLQHQPYEGRLRRFLQDVEDVFYWMINRSNFYQSVHEAFMVGGTLGTAVMYSAVSQDNKIYNTVEHLKNVYLAENDAHEVDTLFREIQMTGKDIVRRWKSELKPEFLKRVEESPYEQHSVLHAVLPRDTRDATKWDKLNKKFASYYILISGRVMLEESGFNEFPYTTWRWSTAHGGTYGWGPAHNALADIYRSNQINKGILEAGHLFLYPALNVPYEQMDQLDLRPKGMNPYVDPSRRVYPIQNTGNFPIARDREEAIERAIRDHFFVDMFLMLNQAAENANRTATEVMEMQAEKAAVMGSITSRIESEFFDPLFDRYYEIALEQGWLPPPPPELIDMLAGQELKVDYVGPMTQIQSRFYSKQSVDQPMQRLLQFAQFFPEMLDVIDSDALGRHMANDSSLPQDIIRSRRDTEAIRQQRAQMQQAQMQAEVGQKSAKAAKDLGDTDQPNLQKMMQEAAGVARE
jgi:hypothetical protein